MKEQLMKEQRQKIAVNSPDVLIVCALMVEAKSIIEHYGLQHIVTEYGFKMYGLRPESKGRKVQTDVIISVLVAGVGKINMASSLMWAQIFCAPKTFINFGIAGHGSANIGDVFLIKKIIDESTRKTFYPSINFSWKTGATQLKTVDRASDEYLDGYAYDMEASSFYDTVTRFVSSESAQILKVISDNKDKSYQQILQPDLQEQIKASLTMVDALVQCLCVNKTVECDEVIEVITSMHERWHITVAQEQQLRETLLSMHVIEENTGLTAPKWESFSQVKPFLQESKKWLINIKPKLV